MALRDYQRECLDNIASARQNGINKMLCVAPTGSGKAVILSHIPESLSMQPGEQMLTIVHRKELVNQLAEKLRQYNPDLKVDIERAQYKADPNADLIVASIQTIGRARDNATGDNDFNDRLRKFDPGRLRHVVIDECFVAGTLVDGVPIQSVRAGDLVFCLDHAGRPAVCRVARTFKSPVRRLVRVKLSDGTDLICTPNHPVYTERFGYIEAASLQANFFVVRAPIMPYTGIYANTGRPNQDHVHHLREGSHPSARDGGPILLPEARQGVLLDGLLHGVPSVDFLADHVPHQPQVRFQEDDRPQSDEQPGVPCEVHSNATSDALEANCTGREWPRTDGPAAIPGSIPWVADGGNHPYGGTGEGRLSVALQAGHREPGAEDRGRSGRDVPQCFFAEISRRQEGRILDRTWVESVEVLEPGSDGTFGGLCPDGFVYNLEVPDFHNYFANGVLVHNCHHAARTKSDYGRVLRYLSVFKPDFRYDDPSKTLTGFTATPGRADNIGLETILDKIVFSRELRQMMESGMMVDGVLRTWLCDVRAWRVDTTVDISDVSTNNGDFAVGELERTVNTASRNKLIVDKYIEKGEGQTFFAFSVDVAHSTDLAAAFQERGIQAYPISGKTPDDERRRLMRAFTTGDVRGLVSCGVLSEGIDLPSVGCLLMARPTKSSLLFRQQVGRGLRPFPAPEYLYECWKKKSDSGYIKPYVIVLDFADVSRRHVLNAIPSLFGLSPTFNMKGASAKETVEQVERAKAKAPGVNLDLYTDLESLKGVVEKIDLFAKPRISEEIRKFSRLAWVTGISAGAYQLCLPDKGMLTVKVNTLGQYDVYRHVQGVRSQLTVAPDLKTALMVADKAVPREAAQMLSADAQWRYAEPTEKQIGLLKKLYPEMRRACASDGEFATMVAGRYSKGEVSTLISQRIERLPRRA